MLIDYSLSSVWKGKSWKDWISKLNVDHLVKEKDKKHSPKKQDESVRSLPRKDIVLHGQYPKEEIKELCNCDKCGKVVLLKSYMHHQSTRHGPGQQQPQKSPAKTTDLKKKSKTSKNKKKPSTNSNTPNAAALPTGNHLIDFLLDRNTLNEGGTQGNTKGKSLSENIILENAKKSSSSKTSNSSSSSHSLNKKRSKSKSDDQVTKSSDDKKSKDTGFSHLLESKSSDHKLSNNNKESESLNKTDRGHITKDSYNDEREKSHSSKDKHSSYCCEKCGKVFDGQDLLASHQKYKHSSSLSNSKHTPSHTSSNAKSSTNKKKSVSSSKNSSSSKKQERSSSSGSKPYTELVSDLSSLINHKGKTWVDISTVLDNKRNAETKESLDYVSVRALPRWETKLFGSFPKTDPRILTACEKCTQIFISHEIGGHQKFFHSPENCPMKTPPSTPTFNNLSPNSLKKKNNNNNSSSHLKNKKRSLLISSTASTPVVSKSAPSSPPSPLQASSSDLSPSPGQAIAHSKASIISISSTSSSNSSSPASPTNKKQRKEGKQKMSIDNTYFSPEKQNNNLSPGKNVSLRSLKSSDTVRTVPVLSKGLSNFENVHRNNPPVQIVKPFMPQQQSPQQNLRSLSPSLMPPPPTPPNQVINLVTPPSSGSSSPASSPSPTSSKSKKSKKNYKRSHSSDSRHSHSSENSPKPCLRSIKSICAALNLNDNSKVQPKNNVINKNNNAINVSSSNNTKDQTKLQIENIVKEKNESNSGPGPSVPRLLDDDMPDSTSNFLPHPTTFRPEGTTVKPQPTVVIQQKKSLNNKTNNNSKAVNKNKELEKLVEDKKVVKETEVIKTASGPSVPKLLDDNDDIPDSTTNLIGSQNIPPTEPSTVKATPAATLGQQKPLAINKSVNPINGIKIVANDAELPQIKCADTPVLEKENIEATPDVEAPNILKDVLPDSTCNIIAMQPIPMISENSTLTVVNTAVMKVAPVSSTTNVGVTTLPQLFSPIFSTPIITTLSSESVEGASPPESISPDLSPVSVSSLSETFSSSLTSSPSPSTPTIQTNIQSSIQPSLPTFLQPTTIQTVLQPTIHSVQTTIQPNYQNTFQTCVQSPIIHTTFPTVQPTNPTFQTNQTSSQAKSPTIYTTTPPAYLTTQPVIQSTIQTTIQNTPTAMQPIQFTLSPNLNSEEALLNPSQIVLLPMSPVSVVSPVQEKDINNPVLLKATTPKVLSDKMSHSRKTNMVSILRKNNEPGDTPDKLNQFSNEPGTFSTSSTGHMVSILRKPNTMIDQTVKNKETDNKFVPILPKGSLLKEDVKNQMTGSQKYVHFTTPVIRVASQPFINSDSIYLTVPVSNLNSSVYTPHPRPLNSGYVSGGLLKRHGVAVSTHRAASRVEFLRSDIQQTTISRRSSGNSNSMLNMSHHRPNILKQPRGTMRIAGVKRSATDRLSNDSKQIRLSTDTNGFIVHTDISDAAEAPQPTNSLTLVKLK